MAYVTPVTVAPGEIWTASQHNQDVRDNVIDLNARMNTALKMVEETITSLDGNGSVTLANNAATCVLFDAASTVDVNGCEIPDVDPFWRSFVNVSTGIKTMKHEDATEPTPAKRFFLPGGTDIPLDLGQGILLQYVSVPLGARWCGVTLG